MPESNRTGRVLGIVVLLATLAGGGFWLSRAVAPWSYTKQVVVEPQGYFFRVKASYTHGDEKIEFDYVAVCGYRTTVYKDNSSSNDGTYDPKVMIRASADGSALMIRTPRACHGETTANGKAPADLLPFVVWFDDVEDLTFGWGYASPDAYDSPHAQVAFHGATIEAATREEWEAWRAKAESEYEPKGILPGPWGWSYPDSRPNSEPYDPAMKLIAKNCDGYIRLKLPEEARTQIREIWPEDWPEYWVPPSTTTKITMQMPYAFYPVGESAVGQTAGRIYRNSDGTLRTAVPYPDGREYFNFVHETDRGEIGVPTRRGGGTLRGGAYAHYVADIFPLLPRSRSMSSIPNAPRDSYPRRLIVQEEMKGFVACGGDERVDDIAHIDEVDSRYRSKKHPIYINDRRVVGNYSALVVPSIIYQRNEYVYDRRAWPAYL